MTDVRRAAHLAIMAGLSVGAYASSLAWVTAWQSANDANLTLARSPAARAVDDLTRSHDALEATITDASRSYTLTADGYDALVPRLETTEAALDKLAKAVNQVTGGVGNLPSHVSLPKIKPAAPAPAAPRATKPPSHGSTGGSG